MKKQLNETAILNELKGGSLYFQQNTAEQAEETNGEPPRHPQPRKPKKTVTIAESPSVAPAPSSETVEKKVEPSDELLETIRRSVKQLGKEATFCRFTQEEKSALTDILYTYKRNGVRTSENEVIRIAVNWLLGNYAAAGEASVLAKVLEKLNA